MGMFQALNISATGLAAQKLRMDVISNNLANVNTTRTTEGGPFKRSRVVLRPKNSSLNFKSMILPNALRNPIGNGVSVVKIDKDITQGKLRYDPTHPDAYKFGPNKGYVEMPNINVVTEMVDMISASRAYEANITMMNASKQMFMRALDIGSR